MTIALLSDALKEIATQAPMLQFSIQPPSVNPRGMLERGEVDFLVMPDVYCSPEHPMQPLIREGYKAVIWDQNPDVGDTMDLKKLLELPHVAVRFANAGPTYEGWVIERYANEMSVEVEVGSFSSVPFLIVGTRRAALMHERLANIFARTLPLRLMPCPVDIPLIQEAVQWNLHNSNDNCLTWVREQLISASKKVDD